MTKNQWSIIKKANEALLVRGDADAVGRYFSPDYQVRITGKRLTGGHRMIRQVIALYQTAFSGITTKLERLAEQDDRVAWQRTIRATQSGPFKGFPATDRVVVWREMITSRFVDGLIAEEWFVTDLAEQLLLSRKTRKTGPR